MIHGRFGLKVLEKLETLNLAVSWASFKGELCEKPETPVGQVRVTKREDSNIEIFPQYKIVLCLWLRRVFLSLYSILFYFIAQRIEIEMTVTTRHSHIRVGIIRTTVLLRLCSLNVIRCVKEGRFLLGECRAVTPSRPPWLYLSKRSYGYRGL